MPITDRINALPEAQQAQVMEWMQANEGCSLQALEQYIQSL